MAAKEDPTLLSIMSSGGMTLFILRYLSLFYIVLALAVQTKIATDRTWNYSVN